MGYVIKEYKDGFSFDIFAKGEFIQNIIVYNLNSSYTGYANILQELNEIGKDLTSEEFKELDRFSLYLGFDKYITPSKQFEISELIYNRIYKLFKKGYYDKYIF